MTTESSKKSVKQTNNLQIMFWVTLLRGFMAITLGLALWIQPQKLRPFLITSMGMFWLVSGVMSIRWGLSGKRARGMPLLAGIVGVLAGLAALSRRFELLDTLVSDVLVITVLGIAILLTGLMHMLGGFRTGEEASREWSWTSFLMGLFEFIMGAMLILEPMRQGTLIYLGVSIWAMIGGVILIGDALRLRSRVRKTGLSE
ncbi:MAG: DUF308 domain-containing protein [Anaerolineales bacterium]|nr:DUF308 domain-containing protein [Anaerolineales bacterium]